MYTILLLLFSALLQICSSIKDTSIQKLMTRKFNNGYDDCVCFPGGELSVSEIIDPNGHGLERLVVFLYKNLVTNEIKMFSPSKEKQALIPNIPFSAHDSIKTITIETVASLMSDNPFDILTNIPAEDHSFINAAAIGLKKGRIEKINQTPSLYGVSQQLNYNSVPNVPFTHQPNTDIYASAGSNHAHLTFDGWFQRQMEKFKNIKSPNDVEAIDTNLLKSLIQTMLFENNMQIGSTGIIIDANGAPVNLNNLELRPVFLGNSVTYDQALQGGQNLILPKHLPYLEGLVVSIVYPPKVLGIIPLAKTYVAQPNLQQNNALYVPGTHVKHPANYGSNWILQQQHVNPYKQNLANNQWPYSIPQYSSVVSPFSSKLSPASNVWPGYSTGSQSIIRPHYSVQKTPLNYLSSASTSNWIPLAKVVNPLYAAVKEIWPKRQLSFNPLSSLSTVLAPSLNFDIIPKAIPRVGFKFSDPNFDSYSNNLGVAKLSAIQGPKTKKSRKFKKDKPSKLIKKQKKFGSAAESRNSDPISTPARRSMPLVDVSEDRWNIPSSFDWDYYQNQNSNPYTQRDGFETKTQLRAIPLGTNSNPFNQRDGFETKSQLRAIPLDSNSNPFNQRDGFETKTQLKAIPLDSKQDLSLNWKQSPHSIPHSDFNFHRDIKLPFSSFNDKWNWDHSERNRHHTNQYDRQILDNDWTSYTKNHKTPIFEDGFRAKSLIGQPFNPFSEVNSPYKSYGSGASLSAIPLNGKWEPGFNTDYQVHYKPGGKSHTSVIAIPLDRGSSLNSNWKNSQQTLKGVPTGKWDSQQSLNIEPLNSNKRFDSKLKSLVSVASSINPFSIVNLIPPINLGVNARLSNTRRLKNSDDSDESQSEKVEGEKKSELPAIPASTSVIDVGQLKSRVLNTEISSEVTTIPTIIHHKSAPAPYPYSDKIVKTETEETEQKDESEAPTRRVSVPIIESVLKSIINMVLQNLAQSGNRRASIEPNITVASPIQKTGQVQDVDQPDFRIIGGSAATGSGSPLSNKGRSGISIS